MLTGANLFLFYFFTERDSETLQVPVGSRSAFEYDRPGASPQMLNAE